MNIVIYGKQNCQQCDVVKKYLDARTIPYDYRELDKDFVREDMAALAPNARTFPVIFVNGNDVGGFSGLMSALIVEGTISTWQQLLVES